MSRFYRLTHWYDPMPVSKKWSWDKKTRRMHVSNAYLRWLRRGRMRRKGLLRRILGR